MSKQKKRIRVHYALSPSARTVVCGKQLTAVEWTVIEPGSVTCISCGKHPDVIAAKRDDQQQFGTPGEEHD
jgi:hypothetical protein